MIHKKLLLGLGCVMTPILSFAQTTYICQIHGKAAYTTVKENSSCKVSQINGIDEASVAIFAPPIQVASQVALPNENPKSGSLKLSQHDPIADFWEKYEYGSYDQTPILPPPPPRATADSSSSVNSSSNSNPNHQKTTNKNKILSTNIPKTSTLPVAHIPYQAPSAPVLSRRDILNQEIEREQIALKVAESQLATAKKRNDTISIQKLNNVLMDRRQNVAALQRELNR